MQSKRLLCFVLALASVVVSCTDPFTAPVPSTLRRSYPGVMITGSVSNFVTGKPISDVQIHIESSGRFQDTFTDDQGNFSTSGFVECSAIIHFGRGWRCDIKFTVQTQHPLYCEFSQLYQALAIDPSKQLVVRFEFRLIPVQSNCRP